MSFLREERRFPYRASQNVTNEQTENNLFSSDIISPIRSSPVRNSSQNSYQRSTKYRSQNRNNDNFHVSISIAKNSVKINQLRRDLSQLKSTFVAEFDSFQSVLAKARSDIFENFQRQTSSSFFNRGTTFRQREAKIASLEQRVAELTEQLKAKKPKGKSTFVLQLQEELEEKKVYIEEMEQEYQQEIQQLKYKVQEQADTIREFKSMKFQLVQLQMQIDDKNRTIQKLKDDYSTAVSQLNTQIESNETAAEDIQYTIESINKLKTELSQNEINNSNLKKEMELLKDELEKERNENVSLKKQLETSQTQLKQLINEAHIKDDDIEDLTDKVNELSKLLHEKEEIIENQQNEIAVLEAEKSFAHKHQEIAVSDSASSMVFNTSQRELQKIKIENLSLSTQIDKLTTENKELKNLVQALRVNIQQSEESMSLMKDQYQKSQSSFERKESRVHSFKEEIIRLQSVLEQKEKLISELMESENNRSKEIERLHEELEKSNKEQLNTSLVDEKFHEEFQDMSQKLSESNSKINSMDVTIKQQNEKIKELNTKIREQKNKISLNERENLRINQENASLKSQNDANRIQTESVIKGLQRQLDTLQEQFETTVKENAGFSEKYNNLMKNIQTNTEKADQLFIENTDLRRENAELIKRINTELLPMKDENQRLKDLVEKLRNTEKVVTEENTRIFTENAILKKTSKNEVSLLKESVNSKHDELLKANKIIADNAEEIAKCHEIIDTLYSIYHTDSAETVFDLSRSYIEKCNQLQKLENGYVEEIDTLKKDNQRMKTEISEFNSKFSEIAKKENSHRREIESLKEHIADLESNIT